MVKDIKVGQKFLSNGVEVEIVCVTGKKSRYPIIDNYGDCYTPDGRRFADIADSHDLQPIPVKIEEGVKFSGEQYRAEFERLVAEGREFEFLQSGRWNKKDSDSFYELTTYRLMPQKITIPEGEPFRIISDAMRRECLRLQDEEERNFVCDTGLKSPDLVFGNNTASYTLLPQHRDAVGNPLKFGDRVECRNSRFTVSAVDGQILINEFGNPMRPSDCRKIKTRTRPLCADDLEKSPHPMFRSSGHVFNPDWSEHGVQVSVMSLLWTDLDDYEWRPSADQPWGPCEVTEEVPV